MTQHIEKRIATLERKAPIESNVPLDELNWMLTTYDECDAQLQKLPNYKELTTQMYEGVMQWYGEWHDLWIKASETDKKQLLASIHQRVREEFLKVKQGEKLPCFTKSEQ